MIYNMMGLYTVASTLLDLTIISQFDLSLTSDDLWQVKKYTDSESARRAGSNDI